MALKAQFTAYCGRGRTANGSRPNEHTCAAPKEIPFGTRIKVGDTGTKFDGRIYTVTDRGGAIKVVNGRYIFDLWLPSNKECINFGRQNGTATILEKSSSSKKATTQVKVTKDIVDIAISQIGYREQGKNRTKYGAYTGTNGSSWCHAFISWCAHEAGVSTNIVPKTASTGYGMNWFKKKGRFKYKGKYTPKRGDIVYFKTGRSHAGLVEKVKGSILHTVEGNTSDKVARRTYSLNDKTITGYGVPDYKYVKGSGRGSLSSKTKGEELAYLRKVLKQKSYQVESIKGSVVETGKLPNCNVVIMIKNGKNFFEVPPKEGMKIVWERKGTPGKLTFEAKYDKKFKIVEGNAVTVSVNNKNFFFGFVFSRETAKDGMMKYTVYDQLRYLKNKDTIIYENKRADEMLALLAKKFNLNAGTFANTVYRMSAIEDNSTLIDIVQSMLDETLRVKNKLYVLYDKCGKLTLTDVTKMKVDSCLVDEETGEDFKYKTSIDSDVYNQIKLIYENKKKGTYDLYITKHNKNINKWGVLQYVEKINTPDVGKLKSAALLKLYNQKQKTLSVSKVIGNVNVRAGSLVPVMLDIKDMKIAHYMLVEKVTHTFENRRWSMDLVLSGGGFSE